MTHRVRLALTASFLLSSTVAAQQILEHARDAAFREAERYSNCWMRGDLACIEELTHREGLDSAGLASRERNRLQALAAARDSFIVPRGIHHRLEVAEPWPPFAVDDVLFAFVPTLETWVDPGNGRRTDRMAYLVGASEDDGESWRYIQVNEDSTLRSNDIDRVIPGYGDGPRPEIRIFAAQAIPVVHSRWLVTTQRGFGPVDNAFAYILKLDIRREVEDPIDLIVRYDDPVDRNQPLEFRGSLAKGQRTLEWQSPALSGFEFGETYNVVFEGRDPDGAELLFEHRERLLYQPTRELWLSDYSKPPAELPN